MKKIFTLLYFLAFINLNQTLAISNAKNKSYLLKGILAFENNWILNIVKKMKFQ